MCLPDVDHDGSVSEKEFKAMYEKYDTSQIPTHFQVKAEMRLFNSVTGNPSSDVEQISRWSNYRK